MKNFRKVIFIFTILIINRNQIAFKTSGTFKKTGAQYDIDSNENVKPNVHMLEGQKSLPLNPRMSIGQTTILSPGKTELSPNSIAENIKNQKIGKSLPLTRKLSMQQETSKIENFHGNSGLNDQINGLMQTQQMSLIENQSFSSEDPNSPQKNPLRQLELEQIPETQNFKEPINLIPNVIFHKNKKTNPKKSKKNRKLQTVGEVSFPYEGTLPQRKFAAPPTVINFRKQSNSVPKLNDKIFRISENRNSYYLNPIEDTLEDGEGILKLDRYMTLRQKENKMLKAIEDIKDIANQIQIDMDHNTSFLNNKIQRTIQLVDATNII